MNIGVKYDLEILHVLLEKKTHLLKIIVLIYSELFLVLTEKYFTVNTIQFQVNKYECHVTSIKNF